MAGIGRKRPCTLLTEEREGKGGYLDQGANREGDDFHYLFVISLSPPDNSLHSTHIRTYTTQNLIRRGIGRELTPFFPRVTK